MSEVKKYTPDQSIFTDGRRLSLSLHNVGGLLPLAERKFGGEVDEHYGPRSGANDYAATSKGIIVTGAPTDILQSHAKYLGIVYQDPSFKVYTLTDLAQITANLKPGDTKPLVVPYYNGGESVRNIAAMGAETWGLPFELSETLKNKISFHELVTELGIDGFEVPEYKKSSKDEYVQKSLELLRETKDMYQQYGLADRYPLGVMIRLEESDGNYGSSRVKQEPDGRISITPDGKIEATKFVDIKGNSVDAWNSAWTEALLKSKDLMYKNVDAAKEPGIIISRYLDIVDSPGLSTVFMDGDNYPLGWNGQLQVNGSTATVGTHSYVPKTAFLEAMQNQYEDQSAAAFTTFLKRVAEEKLHIPFDSIRGIANIDVMIYGRLEQELREKMGKKQGYYVAESNPRWTNFTDAIMAAIGATGRVPSVNSMKEIIREEICNVDSVPLKGATVFDVRAHVQALDSRDAKHRIIVRMPDDPMGVILLGDRKEANHKLKQIIEDASQIQKTVLGNETLVFPKGN